MASEVRAWEIRAFIAIFSKSGNCDDAMGSRELTAPDGMF